MFGIRLLDRFPFRMRKNRKIFYLSTAGESSILLEPRACRPLGRLRDFRRDDYMLVEIEPPLVWQVRSSTEEVIGRLVLATRHEGETLYPVFRVLPIRKWGLCVYVVRLLDESNITSGWIREWEVELIAWGSVFRNREDAERAVLSHARAVEEGLRFMGLGADGKPLGPAK